MEASDAPDNRFIRWASIEGLHHVRRNLIKEVDKQGKLLPPFSVLPRSSVVSYKCKIKLHGVNSAITFNDGTMRIQSRNTYLDEAGKSKGGFGFAKWVGDNKAYFGALQTQVECTLTKNAARKHHLLAKNNEKGCPFAVFGEWAGPGVQKGVALSQLPRPIFCVFSLRVGDHLIIEPSDIRAVLTQGNISVPSDMHVLPWHRDQRLDGNYLLDLCYSDEDQLQRRAELVNTMIQEIDKEDPWIRESFEVIGPGEGLVWYPISFAGSDGLLPDELFTAFSFKTKGTSHQMVIQKIAGVQLHTEIAANSVDFAEMFCTIPRFNQGAVEACQGLLQKELRSKFVAWVLGDIKKEGSIELIDSKLAWSAVEPLIKARAEAWFETELLSEEGTGDSEGQLFTNTNFAFAEKVSFKEKSDLTATIKKLDVIFMLPNKGGFYLIATLDDVKANSYKVEQALKKPNVKVISGQFISDSAAQGRLVSLARYTLASSTPASSANPSASSSYSSSSSSSSYSSSSSFLSTSTPVSTSREDDAPQERNKRVTATVYTHGSTTEPSFSAHFAVQRWDLLHLMDMSGNSNKYYSIELHESEERSIVHRYRIFTHHGRTDEIEASAKPGTKECRYLETNSEATTLYEQILNEKLDPEKGYHRIFMQAVASKIGSGRMGKQTVSDSATYTESDVAVGCSSSLVTGVQNLINFLFQQASDALASVLLAKVTKQGIETPLGLVSSAQIAKGEEVLQRLCKALGQHESTEEIVKLNSEFYSLVPHKLGKRKEEVQRNVIDNAAALEEKQNLLQLMRDLVAMAERSGHWASMKSEVDRRYISLGCAITQLEPGSAKVPGELLFFCSNHWWKYKEIQTLVLDSKPQLPSDYMDFRFVVKNIFAIKREQEFQDFAATSAWMSNNRLLVHASRAPNFVGLLSRGLLLPKIVLKERLSMRTDFGFLGAGIYFSDNVYSSVKYTTFKDSPQQTPASRFALIASVALGNTKDYMSINADLDAAPDGYNSCHGVASTPNIKTDFKNDEYVVYNESQVRLDFLIEFSLAK